MANNMLRVGSAEVMALLDASVSAPAAVMFPSVPAEEWAPHAAYAAGDDRVLSLSMTSLLVRAGGKTILIDTGMGAKDRPYFPNGRLPEALTEAGVRPDDVDVVAVTHIHVDHVGGHTMKRGEAWVPAFPKSRHVFVEAEWDYWTHESRATAPGNEYVVDCVLPLRDTAPIDLVPVEYRLTDEITMLATPGHTPAHTSYLISSGGESAVILGDVAHTPVQVTTNWSGVFDVDPEQAARTREGLMERLADEGHTLIAGHFPFPGFGRVVRVDGRRYWRGR